MTTPMLPSNWFSNTRLKIRHLQLFVALDVHRNVHRAAESIGISQPAASKLLNDLERGLGVQLFTRLPRGIAINEYGEIMVRRARVALSELTRAGEEFFAARRGYEGAVSVGTVGALGVDIVAKAIKQVRRAHPRLQIDVEVANSELMTEQLLEGRVDFAICRLARTVDAELLNYQELGGRRLSFICRWDHPLKSKSDLRLADLAGAEWILQPTGMIARNSVDSLFRANSLPTPYRVINSTSFLMTLAMLRETDALSVVGHSVAKHFASFGSIATLLEGQPLMVDPVGILRLKSRQLLPGAKALLDAIVDVATPDWNDPPEIRPRIQQSGKRAIAGPAKPRPSAARRSAKAAAS